MLFILMYQFCNVFFKNFSLECLLIQLMLYRISILFDKFGSTSCWLICLINKAQSAHMHCVVGPGSDIQ